MSLLNKFKTNSYCVGGRHYSGTVNIRESRILILNLMLNLILNLIMNDHGLSITLSIV